MAMLRAVRPVSLLRGFRAVGTPRAGHSVMALPTAPRVRVHQLCTAKRWCSMKASSAGQDTGSDAANTPNPDADAAMSYWLFSCAGMVFAIVVVGGITRLTESGLSIVDWRPVTGMIPPLNDEEWAAEFKKYQTSPEFMQNPHLTLEDFKGIFFWEWAHRALGRTVGMVYFLPLCYFAARGRVARHNIGKRLAVLGGLGGLQGLIGWLMVKSGLDHQTFEKENTKATVSPYRLALHLGTAFILFLGLTSTAIQLKRGTLRKTLNPELKPLKKFVHASNGFVFCTAMTGAAVAGLDAGWIYCEFPMMGEGLVPPMDDLFLKKCEAFWPRNLYENPVFAQFAHRCMAMSTLCMIALLSRKARAPATWAILSKTPAGKALLAVELLVVWQVGLGITTLCNETPIPLAVAHQASSLLLLTSIITFQVLLL